MQYMIDSVWYVLMQCLVLVLGAKDVGACSCSGGATRHAGLTRLVWFPDPRLEFPKLLLACLGRARRTLSHESIP
jgi:hypothetical protein